MKPKIIFTVTNDLSYDQRMIRICQTLVKANFDILLVGRAKPTSVSLKEMPFQQIRLNLFFNRGKLFYLAYNLRLIIFLLKNRFDIVGSIDLDTLLPGFIISRLKGKPCVFDAHEYFTEVPEVVNRPLTKWVWHTLGNLIIPNLKYAYTVSASLQQLFSKKYGIPFQLIRNISELQSPPSNKSSRNTIDKPIILYQGVLNEGRGLSPLIEAMVMIDNAILWIAGEGDLSTILRKKAIDLGLNDRIKFLGYLSPIELKKVTAKASIGLNLLANKGLSYYYSLANKTFDYIHAEVPAIHMDFPEYQAINKEIEIGILLKDLTKESITQAIQKLLNNSTYYQKLKSNCRQAKELYHWEKEAIKLVDFYKNIHN